ncbi:anti-sigma regulatory factor [Dyadobacter arcticus]|uniref:Anti-sigma regulatory factor (Ser/Thr protein kinase) n=1 Tax=Dyadobacter arcticus TaxID=1078754 RepID=A0ABX0UPR1_9BACT|nr:anti-sigma regulatory factor [Dyadobacter arcticus]NIJ53655.1 hypothetical protein [Dyadobacter arcticus]
MNGYSDRFETIFKCDLEAVSDKVNLCIAHIEQSAAGNNIGLGVITRTKWVITEMLTNAIKHSDVEECLLTIRMNATQLLFEKKDNGNPLSLHRCDEDKKIVWPLESASFPKKIQVSHNGSESLWAVADDANHVIFYIQEIGDPAMPALLKDTNEHFGLLILTKASDTFEYHYEPESATNRFLSTFNLQAI